MQIFLHDDNCQPLGVVTLDWDVDKRGPWVRIPVVPHMRAESYSGRELASPVQVMDANVMVIHLTPLRYKKKDGSTSLGWIGATETPDLCEAFFETKF